ncbi:MAG TPA: hypothetical protein VJL32_00965 [Candidatus Paceibacterota bacterium]
MNVRTVDQEEKESGIPSVNQEGESDVDTITKLKADVRGIVETVKEQKGLLFFGFIVVVIMVAAIVLDAWYFKIQNLIILTDRVNQQSDEIGNISTKLDSLTQALLKNESEKNQEKATSSTVR